MRVDITALKREHGVQRQTRRLVEPLDGVELTSAEVTTGLLAVDLILEHLGSQLTANGSLHSVWQAPCRRCLEPITDVVEVPTQEIFERDPVEGETYRLEEEFVDLRPMISEALLLALPIAPLCREDCAGPEPDRFPANIDVGDDADNAADADGARAGDPRWAALDQLTFDTND